MRTTITLFSLTHLAPKDENYKSVTNNVFMLAQIYYMMEQI